MPTTLREVPARHGIHIPPDLLAAGRSDAALPTTTVLLPAYNEEHGLATVLVKLSRLLDATYEIVVVDDGSSDRTALMAELHGAHLIRHGSNRGKGSAFQTGLAYARGAKVITLDADDTYPVEAVPELVDALDRYDMVVGTRQAGRSNISPFNRFGNAVFRHAIGLAAGRRVSDPLTGLYGLQRDMLRRMNLTSVGFGIEAEIVIKAGRLGATVLEIPINYRPRIGESKLSPVRDGLIIGRTVASLALSRPAARQMTVPSTERPSSSS